jgi:hypothetical protein
MIQSITTVGLYPALLLHLVFIQEVSLVELEHLHLILVDLLQWVFFEMETLLELVTALVFPLNVSTDVHIFWMDLRSMALVTFLPFKQEFGTQQLGIFISVSLSHIHPLRWKDLLFRPNLF